MKKRKRKNKKSSKTTIVLLTLFCIIALGVVYFLQKNNSEFEQNQNQQNTQLIDKMRAMLEDEKQRVTSGEVLALQIPKNEMVVKPALPVENPYKSEVEDYTLASKQAKDEEPKIEPKKELVGSGKPRLVIIIDDMVFPSHVRSLNEITYPITPSFLPPTKHHPKSAQITKDTKFYMIHLPLEAIKHATPEENTLKVGDSRETISKRIKELKKLYPKAKYINNHTGSKFTSDLESMDKLLSVLKEEGLIFLDSKTSPHTKTQEVAKKYNLEIHTRDVFLDNDDDYDSIVKQLKDAVRVAKKDGFAIAIGHPHKNTFLVLKEASEILKDVEVVYLKDL